MKTLYIIRHAKSSWSQAGISDFDRTLNDRGFFDAPLMGKILKEKNISPDAIFTSTAKRALLTASILSKEIDFKEDLEKIKRIESTQVKKELSKSFPKGAIVGSLALIGYVIIRTILGNL